MSGATVQDLLIRIGAQDSAGSVFTGLRNSLTAGLQQIKASAVGATEGLAGATEASRVLRGALIATGVGAAAIAVTALISGIKEMVSSTIELGDQLNDMSVRTGVSVESLSTLKYAAEQSGTSLEGLEQGMQRMARGAGEAMKSQTNLQASAFGRLGIQLTDAEGKLRPLDDLMMDAADKLAGMTSGTERAIVAQELFGKSGAQLLPILTQGSAGIQALQERARELGLEMSGETARSADEFNDTWAEFKSVLGGVGQQIGTIVLPMLVSLVRGLVLAGETVRDLALIVLEVGRDMWEPIALGWDLVWQSTKYAITAGINWLGGAFTTGINAIIRTFNTFGESVGVTIAEIDWKPLTEEPAVDFEGSWRTYTTRTQKHWERIGTLSERMAGRITDALSGTKTVATQAATQVDVAFATASDSTRAHITETIQRFYDVDRRSSEVMVGMVAKANEKGMAAGLTLVSTMAEGVTTNAPLMNTASEGMATNVQRRMQAVWADPNLGIASAVAGGLDAAMNSSSLQQGIRRLGGTIAQGIGDSIGGPVGQALSIAVNSLWQNVTNLFSSREGGNRRSAMNTGLEQVRQAVAGGTLTNPRQGISTQLRAATEGSPDTVRVILSAFETEYGLDPDTAYQLLQYLLTPPGEQAPNSWIAQLADQMLNSNSMKAYIRSRALAGATGLDQVVSGPQLFLAGEGGRRERVSITPEGEEGFQGSAGNTIYISAQIQAWDRRDLADYVDRELGPQLQRYLQRQSRRGAWVVESSGVRQLEAA